MQYRLECMQAALEESRNEYLRLSEYLKTLIEMSKAFVLKEDQKPKELENETPIRLIADESVPH